MGFFGGWVKQVSAGMTEIKATAKTTAWQFGFLLSRP
jgi:hypothetical protein